MAAGKAAHGRRCGQGHNTAGSDGKLSSPLADQRGRATADDLRNWLAAEGAVDAASTESPLAADMAEQCAVPAAL